MALLPQDPQKQKQIVAGILPVLVLGAYWYFLFSPRSTTIATETEHLEKLQSENTTAEAIIKQFGPNPAQQLRVYEEHLQAIERLVPRRNDIPALLVAMGEQAADNGVQWGGFSPSAEEPGQYYTKQSYEISVLGPYHQIGSYLASIGALPRIVKPGAMRLSVEAVDGRDPDLPPLLRAGFSVETYILPMPGEEPPAPPPGKGKAKGAKK